MLVNVKKYYWNSQNLSRGGGCDIYFSIFHHRVLSLHDGVVKLFIIIKRGRRRSVVNNRLVVTNTLQKEENKNKSLINFLPIIIS